MGCWRDGEEGTVELRSDRWRSREEQPHREEGGPLPARSHRGRLGCCRWSGAPSLGYLFPAGGAASISEAKCPASTGPVVGVL